ncbi:MAG TPA: ABC transporter ATP-binding protein [Desulfobulbaceae bacterium]|nr:ABC transporter ATP-binding protein [Desulfobulbaceae bacterium]
MNVIEVENLKKSFHEKEVLHNLSMIVQKGDIFGFLGPNGSGKTTTLRILLGLLAADGGKVRVLDTEVDMQTSDLRQRINMLPESHGLYGWMRTDEYLSYFADLYGHSLDKHKVKTLLELVGLSPDDHRPIQNFSRGMKQRLGIARTLVNDPEIIFLDEPTNGLDPKGRRDIHALLKRLNKERQMTIILSTHILDDVEHLCNRIGILHQGRLQYQGTLQGNGGDTSANHHFCLPREIKENIFTKLADEHFISPENGLIRVTLEDAGPDETVTSRMLLQTIPVTDFINKENDLEDLYLRYTGGTV